MCAGRFRRQDRGPTSTVRDFLAWTQTERLRGIPLSQIYDLHAFILRCVFADHSAKQVFNTIPASPTASKPTAQHFRFQFEYGRPRLRWDFQGRPRSRNRLQTARRADRVEGTNPHFDTASRDAATTKLGSGGRMGGFNWAKPDAYRPQSMSQSWLWATARDDQDLTALEGARGPPCCRLS